MGSSQGRHFSHELKGSTLQHILLIAAAVAQSTAVSLTSGSLHQGRLACPGQQLTFTCLVPEGALIIAWSSEEYIGERGVQIELTHGEGEGYTKNGSSHPTTVATLVKLKEDHIVESTLSIVVSSHYEAATITCVNVGHNKSSISFKLLAVPNVVQNVTVMKTTLVQPRQTKCIMTLHWASPSNSNETIISDYIIKSQLGSFKTIGGRLIDSASFFLENCKADNFTINAVDVCDRDGASLGRDDAVKFDKEMTMIVADTNNSLSAVTCGALSPSTDKIHAADSATRWKKVALVGLVLCCLVIVVLVAIILIYLQRNMTKAKRKDEITGESSSIPMTPHNQEEGAAPVESASISIAHHYQEEGAAPRESSSDPMAARDQEEGAAPGGSSSVSMARNSQEEEVNAAGETDPLTTAPHTSLSNLKKKPEFSQTLPEGEAFKNAATELAQAVPNWLRKKHRSSKIDEHEIEQLLPTIDEDRVNS